MKSNWFCRALTTVLCFSLIPLSAALAKSPAERPIATENPAVAANSDFAIDLYRQLAKESPEKNVFFSPYSMSSALAMTVEGARGETALEMGKVLRFPTAARREGDELVPWNTAAIHSGMAALNDRYSGKQVPPEIREKVAALRAQLADANRKAAELRADRKFQESNAEAKKSQELAKELNALLPKVDPYEIRVANALWGDKRYPFEPSFVDTIRQSYRTGGIFPVDFEQNANGERLKINGWVEDQTNHRITNLLPPGSIDADTRLVLTNAIYFKGEWQEPFTASATKEEDFTAGGKKLRVAMMHKDYMRAARYAAFNADGTFFDTPREIERDAKPDAAALYPGEGGFLVAELPYKGGDLSVVALLPQDAGGLAELEKKLTSDNLRTWLGKLDARTVNVFLPKFKLETSYDMKATLTDMGMVRAFVDPGKAANGAQFDGMCSSTDPKLRLYINKVLHKAFVEVNEKGTEAAAATAVVMPRLTMAAPRPRAVPFIPTFRADKPFLFVIRDMKTGTILFVGRMIEPKA